MKTKTTTAKVQVWARLFPDEKEALVHIAAQKRRPVAVILRDIILMYIEKETQTETTDSVDLL